MTAVKQGQCMTVVNVRVTMASKGSRFEFVTEQGGCALDSVGGCGWNEKCGVVDDDVGRGECNCGSLGGYRGSKIAHLEEEREGGWLDVWR